MSVVANVAINVDSRNAVSKLREVQSQAQQTEKAFGGIAAAAGKLAAAFGLIQAARFVFVKTAEIESQTRSLQVLTGSAEKAGRIIKELQQLGAVTPFTSTELIDAAKRLQAFGVEADKVVETTRRLADASGATGAELSGLVTAYGQVQAKGRLQGEELLQFQERGIALQEELRKMYGMTGEEFQKALSKGQVSAKAVEVALQRLTDIGGKYANGAIAQSDTLNGRLSTLQDSIGVLAQTIGKTLAPVFQWALSQATAVVSEIQRIIDEANNTGGARSREMQFARNAESAVGRMNLNPFTQQGMMADMRQRNIEQQRADYRLRQQASRPAAAPAPVKAPALLGATGGGTRGGGGGGGGASEAKQVAELAARQAEQLMGAKMQLDLARQLFAIENRVLAARFEGNKPLELARETQKELAQIAGEAAAITVDKEMPAARKLVELKLLEVKSAEAARSLAVDIAQIEIDRNKSFDQIIADLDLELALKTATTEQAREQLRLEAEIAKLAGQYTTEQIGAIAAKKSELARPKTDAERLQSEATAVRKELTNLTDPINMITSAAAGIGAAFSTSFKGIIDGSMTAQQALGSFFTSVADQFLDMAAQIIAKMIQMFILQQALKIFGGAAGGAFTGTGGPSAPSVDYGFTPSFGSGFAKGGVFSNSIVSAPTLFPFADGGTTRMGLMGEAGPEAIMPLKRGTDGKLGVAAQMDGAMQRYRRSSGAAGAAGDGTTATNDTTAAGAPVAIDVRYSVERINDVEYVTASQFQDGMRQAAKQGAEMGRANVYSDLINKRSVRQRMAL